MRNDISKPSRSAAGIARVMICCACLVLAFPALAQTAPAQSDVTIETEINAAAGRWDNLFVAAYLNRKPLLFLIDTGCSGTILDQSLEPMLGKRLGTAKIRYAVYGEAAVNEFAAPELRVGGVPLRVGTRIQTDRLSRITGIRPVKGILGMDCLQHYCLQIDFAGRRLRLLPPTNRPPVRGGTSLPLRSARSECFVEGSIGTHQARFTVDTGWYTDGAIQSELFQQLIHEQRTVSVYAGTTPAGDRTREVVFPQLLLLDQVHRDVLLDEMSSENIVGLKFLARYQSVTFDFSGGTMILGAPVRAR
jgi:hypothetical protein